MAKRAIADAAFRRRAFNRMRQNEKPLTAKEKVQLKTAQQIEGPEGRISDDTGPIELERTTGGLMKRKKR